jgi:uncharacterized protein
MIRLAVIKAVKACNLRCPYCYYINEDTVDYGRVISERVLRRFYSSVAEYIGNAGYFQFVWHGGEPMLLGIKRFRRFVEIQQEYFNPAQIRNVMQTNGTLISSAWCDLLEELKVGLGVSLDGPPEAHDSRRPRVNGKGSHSDIMRGFEVMRSRGLEIGVLCVANPAVNGAQILRYFHDLGIPECDLLIPITNNYLVDHSDNMQTDHSEAESLERFYLDAFEEWADNLKGQLSVRLFDSMINNALGIPHGDLNAGGTNIAENVVLETDGEVCLDPDFWYVDRFDFGEAYRLNANVNDSDFTLRLLEKRIDTFVDAEGLRGIPTDCQSCSMRSVCRGSHPASRYGIDGRYDHRSAYCHIMLPLGRAIVERLRRYDLSQHLVDSDLRRAVVESVN